MEMEKIIITHLVFHKKEVQVGIRKDGMPKIIYFKTKEEYEDFFQKNNCENSFFLNGFTSYEEKHRLKIIKSGELKTIVLTTKENIFKKVFKKIRDNNLLAWCSCLFYPKNFFFCLKYPFWKARNVWTGKFVGYRFTWYDNIPEGWQKAFGRQLSEDIKKAFKLDKKKNKNLTWKKALSFTQIKEKYGTLRLYASATERIMEVLEHYERISGDYCVGCGAKAEYMTTGYILPFCSECFDKTYNSFHVREKTPELYSQYKEEHKIVLTKGEKENE